MLLLLQLLLAVPLFLLLLVFVECSAALPLVMALQLPERLRRTHAVVEDSRNRCLSLRFRQ